MESELLSGQGYSGSGEEEAAKAGLGLWIESNQEMSLADITVAPWLFRASNVLKHYRGFEFPPGERFRAYLHRLFNHPDFKKTCSTEELYLDSYERYVDSMDHICCTQWVEP
jgi:glutathione S-transferase